MKIKKVIKTYGNRMSAKYIISYSLNYFDKRYK